MCGSHCLAVKLKISSYPQNLDNWKSSRRKRQEHIIERVVEVKKLELEEHDRQRRRNKTFSEMMEERGNRGRKLSISLAMYNDEDANDLSDLGIGTSSGKSSVSGDTHDDTHSVLVSIHCFDYQHLPFFSNIVKEIQLVLERIRGPCALFMVSVVRGTVETKSRLSRLLFLFPV